MLCNDIISLMSLQTYTIYSPESRHDDISHGNAFGLGGPLREEYFVDQWITLTNYQQCLAVCGVFLCCRSEKSVEQTVDMSVTWDAMTSL